MTEPAPTLTSKPGSATAFTVASLIVVTGVFFVLASIGAQQVTAEQRVLGWLDPLVELIRGFGQTLADDGTAHARALAVLVSGLAAAVVAAAIAAQRLRAWPLIFAAASLSLAAWGQVELVQLHGESGSLLYAAGLVAAGIFGAVSPARSLAQNQTSTRFSRADALFLGGFSLVALLSRLYALPELPNLFNGEMIAPMLASRTFDGLRWYLPDGMLTNSTGIMHLGPQMLFYKLYGVSVYSLRLAAVLYGVLAVPLFYWLAQRLAGTPAALIGTALLVTAPEQLFWSRLESTNFAPVPVLALVTAHLGLSMVERLSVTTVALAALWLPFGRYFYTAGSALVFYPWLQYLHATVFVRRAWRKAWFALPLLGGGTLLWIAAISIVLSLVNGGPLAISNPAQHGELILRGAGEYSGLGMSELITLQAKSSWSNLVVIVQSLAYRGILSEWYQRDILVGSTTLMVPATVALSALALAYLVGQIQRPRAFAILLWAGLGLLPAVLSMQPTDRRFLLIFPALYLAVGVCAQGFIEATAQRGGRIAAWILTALLTTWILASSLTGLASHLRLPIDKTGVEDLIDFSKPIFAESDTVYFDTDSSWAFVLAFGNAERFLASTPCYRPVRIGEWLRVATDLPCEFTEESYKALFSPQHIESLRQHHDPQRISFLIDMNLPSRQAVDMLKALFPQAQVRISQGKDAPQFVAISFTKADVERLRSPELELGSKLAGDTDLLTTLVAGTHLTPAPDAAKRDQEAKITGGIYIRSPGWYRLEARPPCPAAIFSVDGRTVPDKSPATPMLSGVHAFELNLLPPSTCSTPLTIEARPLTQREATSAPATLLAPLATRVEGAAAPPLLAYPGYGHQRRFADVPGTVIVDFGVDREGNVTTLLQGGGTWRGRRVSSAGEELATWSVPIPSYRPIWGLAVAPDGTSYVAAGGPVYIYDPYGKPIANWPTPPIYSADIVAFSDGHVLTPVSQENSIYMLNPDGSIERKWRHFKGGPDSFRYPVAIATDHAGHFAVMQGDNEVLLFNSPTDHFEPEFAGSFLVSYFEPPSPRRAAFDGAERLLFGDTAGATVLAYSRGGTRMLAETPESDLSTRGFEGPVRIAASMQYIYALDREHRLWQLPRN